MHYFGVYALRGVQESKQERRAQSRRPPNNVDDSARVSKKLADGTMLVRSPQPTTEGLCQFGSD